MELMLTLVLHVAILALPVACVSWTVTHEKVFEPMRQWFDDIHTARYSFTRERGWVERFLRHMAYAPTCEYCFSHYVAMVALWFYPVPMLLFASNFTHPLATIVLTWFALVWVANLYMNLHFRLRLSIRESGNRSKVIERSL